MKIVNEKGKLFGIVNLIDLLMVAAVILVGIAAFSLLRGGLGENSPQSSGNFVTLEYTVRVRMEQREGGPTIEEQLDNVFDRGLLPIQLVADQTFVDHFYLTDFEVREGWFFGADSEGQPVYTVDENRRDVIFTMRGIMEEPVGVVYRVATQEVRVGRNYFVKTQLYEMSGLVETLIVTPVKNPDFAQASGFNIDNPDTWNWNPDTWAWTA
jgi:hypothetical protein